MADNIDTISTLQSIQNKLDLAKKKPGEGTVLASEAAPAPTTPATPPAVAPAVAPPVTQAASSPTTAMAPSTADAAAEAAALKEKKIEADVNVLKMQNYMKLSDDQLRAVAEQYPIPDLANQLIDAKKEYEKREEELGSKQALSSMFSILGHLAVGFYGIKHGVDTSGVKFDAFDWAAAHNRIMDNYKLSAQMRQAEYDAATGRRDRFLSQLEKGAEFKARAEEKAETKKRWEIDRDDRNKEFGIRMALERDKMAADKGNIEATKLMALSQKAAMDAGNSFTKDMNDLQQAAKDPVLWDTTVPVIGIRLGMGKVSDWAKNNKALVDKKDGYLTTREDAEKEAYTEEVGKKLAESHTQKLEEAGAILNPLKPKTEGGVMTQKILSLTAIKQKYPDKWEAAKKNAIAKGYQIVP